MIIAAWGSIAEVNDVVLESGSSYSHTSRRAIKRCAG